MTVDNSLIRVCIRKFCSSGAFGWEEQAGSVSSFHPGFFFTTSSRGLFFFLLFLFWACFTIPSLEANVLRAMTGPPGIAKGRLRGVGKGAFYVNSLIGIFFMSCSLSFGWHEMSTFVFVYMVEFFLFSLFFCLLSSFLVISTFAKSKKHGKTGLRKPGMLFSTLHLLLRYSLFLASHACLVSLPCAFRLCSIT